MNTMSTTSLMDTLLPEKVQPYVFGGIAGMTATTVIQPLDFLKVRIQVAGAGQRAGTVQANPFKMAMDIARTESILGFYNGLSAGLLRQATYTTARLGLFETFMDYAKQMNGGKPLTFAHRSLGGLAAGGLAAIVGTPADVCLIRMQTDRLKPVEQRANYTGVINALVRITRNEGILALWSGCGPTVARAMALNLGMLAFYSQSKSMLAKHYEDGPVSRFGASAIAGFFASFLSLPFDFTKTRLQQQSKGGPDKAVRYKSALDCAAKVFRQEGPFAFYKGFGTYYVRIAPHAMITLLVADGLNSLVKK